MKEKPILFSAPMVRAILEGRKTQTRRIVKNAPLLRNGSLHGNDYLEFVKQCPFGNVGDQLWVREAWAPHADMPRAAIYRCDAGGDYQDNVTPNFRWRPSIHMPRWASRITLEITGVRVERLQDISEEDAKAEGAEQFWGEPERYGEQLEYEWYPDKSYVVGCRDLWQSINGVASWDENPWVWVIEFKRVEDKS